jgi:hypothetical protein
MSFLNSVSSYFYGEPTETTLTFTDEKTTQTVIVNHEKIKPLTKQFEDKKVILIRKVINVNDYVEFFSYVQKNYDNILTLPLATLCKYHNYAMEYEMTSLAATCADYIAKLAPLDIIQLYSENHFCDIHPTIAETFWSHIYTLPLSNNIAYLKFVDLQLLNTLLDKKTYGTPETCLYLERALLALIIDFFNIKYPEVTIQSKTDFMHCIDKIQFDTILLWSKTQVTPARVLDRITAIMSVAMPKAYMNDPDIHKYVTQKLVEQITNCIIAVKPRPERHPSYVPTIPTVDTEIKSDPINKPVPQETNTGLLTLEEVRKLGKFDTLDIMDHVGVWYTGQIEAVLDDTDCFFVSFKGWSSQFNETIRRTAKRFGRGQAKTIIKPTQLVDYSFLTLGEIMNLGRLDTLDVMHASGAWYTSIIEAVYVDTDSLLVRFKGCIPESSEIISRKSKRFGRGKAGSQQWMIKQAVKGDIVEFQHYDGQVWQLVKIEEVDDKLDRIIVSTVNDPSKPQVSIPRKYHRFAKQGTFCIDK